MTLGAVLERVTGQRLDMLVGNEVTGPLGMHDTGYHPVSSVLDRVAATEYRPGRGVIRGSVHDETAAALGGISGNAGIFSTVDDLAVFAQMLLNGGRYGGVRILPEDTVRQMLTNFNVRFPDQDHGLGVELNQPYFIGPLASPVTFGHTGFTRTSIVVDPRPQATSSCCLTRCIRIDCGAPRRRTVTSLAAGSPPTCPAHSARPRKPTHEQSTVY